MSSLEENRKSAEDFFELIWNQKDESAIDRFIAIDAAGMTLSLELAENHFVNSGRSGTQLSLIFILMFVKSSLKVTELLHVGT
jgi:hypothetical protein